MRTWNTESAISFGLHRAAGLFGAAGLLCLATGCNDSSGEGRGSGDDGFADLGTGDGADDGDADDDDGPRFDLPGGLPEVSSIRIEPADLLVEVRNGVIPAATNFDAIGITSSGDEVVIDDYGAFRYSRPDLGTVRIQDGLWEASGQLGGTGVLEFEFEDGRTAQTNAAVKLVFVDDPAGADPGIKDALDQASQPDPSLVMLYPYDQTVFPLGLPSPEIQWNGGAAGDTYRIRAESTYFEFETHVVADPPSRFTFPDASVLPEDVWLKLTESTQGPVEVAVQRYDAAASTAYLPNLRSWVISQANLTGILYYWEVNNGDVVKLTVGDAAPTQFIERPPNDGCVACHSVSADGSTIVAGTYGGASPWATWEADGTNRFWSASQFGFDWPNQDASGFQAVSPDGSYVVTGQSKGLGTLKLSLSNDTASLAELAPPVSGFPVHPAWSPDGQKVAYGIRTDGNWLDFFTSSLWVTDVDTVTPGFTNHTELVAVDPALPTSSYPTFSPDSQWVAYSKGLEARTRNTATELWMVSTDGSVNLRLDQANGLGVVPAAEARMSHEPTFMPVSAGGYFWLVFGSERSYGNTLLTDPTVIHPAQKGTKQLWVTAIDANTDGSSDPSHPAFWMPGQELTNQNMRGSWSLEPCRDTGESCESGFDCCTGFCIDDGMGNKSCSEDAPECSAEGDACDSAADCCSPSAQCVGGFCAEIVPG